jgi:hypothetical protein
LHLQYPRQQGRNPGSNPSLPQLKNGLSLDYSNHDHSSPNPKKRIYSFPYTASLIQK